MASPVLAKALALGCRLRFPYGFIDDDGTHRYWAAGAMVDNLDDMALLQARGVDLEEA